MARWERRTTPTALRLRHFWSVAIAGLLWNGLGAYDFLMTNWRDRVYLAAFPPEAIQYLDEMPYWALGAWALAVWIAVLGSLLLLLRSRFAVPAFAAALLALAASTIHPPRTVAAGSIIGAAATWLAAALLLWYAARMRQLGVLR